jgi:AraC-like DNA-binding protein
MVALLTKLAVGEGSIPSRLPAVTLVRLAENLPRTPFVYEPSICIIAQGRKIITLGLRSFVYDANHYLTVALPTPVESEAFANPETPLLGMIIQVQPSLVTELLMQMDSLPTISDAPHIMDATAVDEPMADAAVRLLECLEGDESARILGPGILREIVYHVLRAGSGANLRALAAPDSRFARIGRILNRLHLDYAAPHNMEALAREAGMSVSGFHAHFKAMTSSSPLQYLKAIRLHKARLLMVNEDVSAAVAASLVGYESISQFSREFKRFFGDTPTAVAARLRTTLLDSNSQKPPRGTEGASPRT